MLRIFFFLFVVNFSFLYAQQDILPKNFDASEYILMNDYLSNYSISSDVNTDPPNLMCGLWQNGKKFKQ